MTQKIMNTARSTHMVIIRLNNIHACVLLFKMIIKMNPVMNIKCYDDYDYYSDILNEKDDIYDKYDDDYVF